MMAVDRSPESFFPTNEFYIFVPLVPTCDPGVGPILTPGASSKQTLQRSTRRCYIPNMKALALTVSDKKIFKNFLQYLYVKSENP